MRAVDLQPVWRAIIYIDCWPGLRSQKYRRQPKQPTAGWGIVEVRLVMVPGPGETEGPGTPERARGKRVPQASTHLRLPL